MAKNSARKRTIKSSDLGEDSSKKRSHQVVKKKSAGKRSLQVVNKKSAGKKKSANKQKDLKTRERCMRSNLFNDSHDDNNHSKIDKCGNMTHDMMYRSLAASPRTLTIPKKDRTRFQVSPKSKGNKVGRRLSCSPVRGAVKSIYECGFTSQKGRKLNPYQKFVKKANSPKSEFSKEYAAGPDRMRAIAEAWQMQK